MQCVLCCLEKDDGDLHTPADLVAELTVTDLLCSDCANVLGLYCAEHHCLRHVHRDTTTYCSACVEAMVDAASIRSHEIIALLHRALPSTAVDALYVVAQQREGCQHEHFKTGILRLLAAKAARQNMSIDDVIRRLIDDQSALPALT